MVKLIITLAMLIALVILITKQTNAATTLLFISFIALLGVTLSSGTALGTSGSAILDVIELWSTTLGSSLAKTLLIIMSVIGYVNYMNNIQASQLFASILAAPLTKLKKPYLMCALVICLEWVLKLVIPSGLSLLSLVIGILYPVLLSVGTSRATCASAFLLGTIALWGPAESGVSLCLSLVGDDASVSEFFAKYEVPMVLINMVVICIVFPITSKFFDKKEGALGTNTEATVKSVKDYDIPKFYAIFPILPLAFVLIFSDLCLKTVKITVPTACFVSLLVVTICRMIAEHKDVKKIINDTQLYFDGMGNFIARIGIIIAAGTLFSTAITKVGGISYIIQLASASGVSPFITCFITGVIAFATVAISGSINANIPLFSGVFYEIATTAGLNPLPIFNVFLLMACPGVIYVPFSGSTLLVAQTCETEMTNTFKRNIIPVAAVMISTAVFSFLLF